MNAVSVCIITYNHCQWIRKAVESVLAQKHDFPLEVLVADDCSTDGTSEIVRELAESHPDEVQVFVNERNVGAGKNFWHVLHEAKGDYLAFLEGDDYWVNEERLNKQLALFKLNPDAELVVANTKIVQQGENEDPMELGEWMHHRFARPGIREVLRQHYHISSYLMRRQVVDRFDAWYGKYGNVLDLYHLCEAVCRVPAVYLDEVVSVRRVTGEGVYSCLVPKKKLEFDVLWAERLFNHFRGTSDSLFYDRVFTRHLQLADSQKGLRSVANNLRQAFRLSPYYFWGAVFRNWRMLVRLIYDKIFHN